MTKINYQALREKAEKATCGVWSLEYGEERFDAGDALIHREVVGYLPICRIEGAHPESGFDEDFQMEQQANAEFIAAANPATVLALLDELERNQQYIKRRDQENEDIALTVGKLRVELEEAKSKLNEQREYYEGVISDGGKRIAELEKQCAEWERKALSNFEECAAMAERIEEMQTKSAPDSFGIIGENIRTQDNRITSDPMFCVYQKREIVVDADYDHDRIVWVDEDGNEANKRHSRRLELLHENFREPPEKWRRVAVKDIDEFVTCCFTEHGCKDYLAVNGHNLRLPFIYVKSGFRNAEYIGIRNWLAGIRIKGE
ncbi:ead/Ea22-like family protein [Escherichia coli]